MLRTCIYVGCTFVHVEYYVHVCMCITNMYVECMYVCMWTCGVCVFCSYMFLFSEVYL